MLNGMHLQSLIWELALSDFKSRYRGAFLGPVWVLLRPLAPFAILWLIFSQIFQPAVGSYALHLLTGIMWWTFFAEGTRVGLQALVAKAAMITKLAVPKLAVVVAAILNVTLTFGVNLIILTVFYGQAGVVPRAGALILAAGLAAATWLLIFGISLATAPLQVFSRDLDPAWEVLLQLGFYAAPIIYPLEFLPDAWRWAIWLNPMGVIIHILRQALLENVYPRAVEIGGLLAEVGLVVVVGVAIWHKLAPRISEHL